MYIVIFITASGKEEAGRIGRALVEKKLAACANIIEGVTSVFRWKGKLDTCQEALLLVKSKKAKFPGIVKLVKAMHSYEVPEIIALPVIAGEKKYLQWLDESC